MSTVICVFGISSCEQDLGFGGMNKFTKAILALTIALGPVCAQAQQAVSGMYQVSPPTLSDGQQQQIRLDSTGAIVTSAGGTGTTANQVQGNVASATTDAGNPVKIGGPFNSTLPTVTNGQRVDAQFSARGHLIVSTNSSQTAADAYSNTTIGFTAGSNASSGTTLQAAAGYAFNGTTWDRVRGDLSGIVIQPYALAGSRWSYAAASGGISNTTTAVTIAAAAGSGIRNYLSSLQLSSDALGAATEIAIRDGASGTVLWRSKIGTAGLTGGESITFAPPLRGTANTLMEVVTLTASVTGAVYVDAQGYTSSN